MENLFFLNPTSSLFPPEVTFQARTSLKQVRLEGRRLEDHACFGSSSLTFLPSP